MPSKTIDIISSASLDDPLYYLRNLQTVVGWVLNHHRDLLIAGEHTQLEALLALPEPAQALLTRMIMRKGEVFRSDSLNYIEIDDAGAAIAALAETGFIDIHAPLDAETLHFLCRREELLTLLAERDSPQPRSRKKSELLASLQSQCAAAQSLDDWWPKAPFTAVVLLCMPLMDRVRLLFFGNLYQDWSEFVLTELGLQTYERVEFNTDSRAFTRRDEVDAYLAIHSCQQALTTLIDEGRELAGLYAQLPAEQGNPWLEYRRQKLLLAVAHGAERRGDLDLALTIYQQTTMDEARVRMYRMQEKRVAAEHLLASLEEELPQRHRPETRLHLKRIHRRLQRKLGHRGAAAKKPALPTLSLTLAGQGQRVEFATLDALADGDSVLGYYTENWLFTGLLGLLLWPAIFEPLPGAFFHPFQSGPADLYRPDFVSRRQRAIDERLDALNSSDYRQLIHQCWREKHGISNSLVHWPALPEALLEQALALIPAQHLQRIFQHLLADLRRHRRGMPDLTLFDLKQDCYQLVEVKGPGDRLQDHQTLWLEAMHQHGIPVAVATVAWEANP